MGLWHVIYEDWQMECCGTAFSVGDEVSWPLLLADADDVFGGGWHDQLTEIGGPVEDVDGVRVVREDSGLTVAVGTGLGDDGARLPKPGSRFRAAGLLSVERHGARWPEVRGLVRAVQVLSQAYAETAPGSRTWEPVAGERRLRAVRRCPGRFAEGEAERGRQWREAAVLATLDVPDTDSRLSRAVREARGIPRDTPPGAETEGLPAADLAALLEGLSTVTQPRDRRGGPGCRRG